MFAIPFDLRVEDARRHHPSGDPTRAYGDIRRELERFGFEWRQGSLHTSENDDMANLFSAILALKALSWFPMKVRDIRASRVEQWSDFTSLVKG